MSEGPESVGRDLSRDARFFTYDVLINILDCLDSDFPSLCCCSQVSRIFMDAAATYLYRSVTYSPAFSPVLNLRKQDDFALPFFSSAQLQHNAALVRHLEVSVTDPSGIANPPRLAARAKTDPEGLPSNGESVPVWRSFVFVPHSRFPSQDNCGSVTPGVLRAFLPHLQEITSFALGLSYSLTDDDVFAFCKGLPSLQTLELRYYLQMRPAHMPRLSKLRSLTVHCQYVSSSHDAAYLYKWVRRTITYTPLESLRLVCEHQPSGAAPSFDPLLEHLVARHAPRLRILDLREFLVGWKALARLCDSCSELEDLFITVSPATLNDLQIDPSPFKRLRRLGLNTRNERGRTKFTTEAAAGFMELAPNLRRLVVNGDSFEGGWAADASGNVSFTVKQVNAAVRLFSWEKGCLDGKPTRMTLLD
ncbi:hypothetical protein GSI_12039 [Ganoderma sinense ZZ0214-1]|uniref:F-box domain-containing protein n=1 Tax=Ganoderma sinense ZZ0214-1 TaxID=1077348 RepID=A0A2G8RXP0_9APHY|nr:hypothetical protein GSI_12039 [Ganoderma sinense ZZ0214-1]